MHHKPLIENSHFKYSEGYVRGRSGTFSDLSRNYGNIFVKALLKSVEFTGTKLLLVCCSWKLVLFSRVLNAYSFQILFHPPFDLVWLSCIVNNLLGFGGFG